MIIFLQFVCQGEKTLILKIYIYIYSDFLCLMPFFVSDLECFCPTQRQVVNLVRGNTPHLRALSSSDLDDEKIDLLLEGR